MKYTLAAVALVACIAGGALAQTSAPPAAPAAPAVAVPASSCAAYPAPLASPETASLKNVKQVDAHTVRVMEWRGQYQAVHDCRRAEIDAIKATHDARVTEALAGQSAAIARINEWQGTVTAFTEKANSKGKKKN